MTRLKSFGFTVIAVTLLSVGVNSLQSQACCTLQGFNSGSSFGAVTDEDVLYLASHSTRTQLNFQINGSDDWDRNSYIINGPQLGLSVSVRRFLTANLILGATISGNTSSISEILTVGGSESDVRFLNLHSRLGWITSSRRNAFWLRATIPVYENYSDNTFSFRTSPVSSAEFGAAGTSHSISNQGKARTFAFTASLRVDGRSDNLYQFKYYLSIQSAWRYRVLNNMRPFVSFHVKHGSLKPLDSAIYQTEFDATMFAYGLFGGGIEYSNNLIKGIAARLYAFYPVLRWSNNRLPAGFEEKPVVGIVFLKSFDLTGTN